MNVTADTVVYPNNPVVVVELSDNANGTVKVIVDGKTFTGKAINGKATVDITGLDAGVKDAVVEFVSSDINVGNVTQSVRFVVDRAPSSVDVAQNGSDVVVSVNATGKVSVYVNGREHNVTIIDGIAVLPNVLVVGNNSVVAVYDGNVNFTASRDSDVFVVDAKSEVKPDVIEQGNDKFIEIPVPEGQTGFITVTVDGKNITVPIENGTAKVNVTGLDVGDDPIEVTYIGDLINPQMNVTVDDAVYPNNSKAVIDLSDNANGTVKVIVDGKTFTGNAINGKATVDITGLDAGVKDAVVEFISSDVNVGNATQKTKFIIDNAPSKVDITQKGDDIIVSVNGEGNVTVYVNGKAYEVPIMDGKATLNDVLTTGNNSVIVVYDGDKNHDPLSSATNIVLSKSDDYTIKVSAKDIVEGQSEALTIDVSADVDSVVVEVDGVKYYVDINGGKGVLNIPNLSEGSYTAKVTYLGDDTYVSKSASTSFTVKSKSVPKINVDVDTDKDVITVDVPKDAGGDVSVVVDGKEVPGKVSDGKVIVDISDLAPGNHSVEVIYDGDKYAPYDETTNFEVPKVDDYTIKVSAKDIVEGQSEALTIDVSADVDSVVVEVDGVKYYVDINGGKGVLNIPNLSEGSYTAKVTYLGDDTYVSKSASTSFTVKSKSVPKINVDVDTDKDVITVDVPKDAGGDVSVVVDGKEVPGKVSDGKVIVDISDLAPGNHSVEVIYDGDKYAPYDETTDFEVPKVDDYKFDVDATVDKDKATITVDLPEDVNGVVLVDVDGVGYYVNATNGKAILDLTYPNDGKHTVTVSYPGDDKYGPAKDTTAFDISYKDNTPMEILVPESPVKGNFTAYVVVAKDAKGYITVEVDGKNFTSEINDGIAKFDISGIDDGKHAVKATYNGDDKHNANTTTAQVEVIKDSIPDVKVSQNGKNIVVDNLPSDAQGNVTIIIGGKELSAPVVNGSANIYCPDLLLGLQNIEVIYEGDNKYSSQNYQKEINIVNAVIITAPVVEKYYSGTERFYVYLEDFYGVKIANASVSITINDVTYNRTTNENGTASIALNLNSMHYPIFVSFNGNEEFNATTVTSAVLINPTIYGNDVVKVFRNGTQYWALFLDAKGNPLVNTTVSFNINGVFYNRTTNATGWAKLNLNLEKGTYILTAVNPVTHEQATNSVVVISLIVENHNLFKYYRNDSQFVVKILADDGNPVGAGEKVRFNIHGVLYERLTDENGYAKLSINLPPGDYIITAYYKDCREGDHIHVLNTLYTDNLEMKYKDGSQFVALVLDGQGRPYAGQTVQFNINGVFYDRVTDSDGNARLNVNLQSGQYLITSTYNGLSNSNTISIT